MPDVQKSLNPRAKTNSDLVVGRPATFEWAYISVGTPRGSYADVALARRIHPAGQSIITFAGNNPANLAR